jgi:hypothetical protein
MASQGARGDEEAHIHIHGPFFFVSSNFFLSTRSSQTPPKCYPKSDTQITKKLEKKQVDLPLAGCCRSCRLLWLLYAIVAVVGYLLFVGCYRCSRLLSLLSADVDVVAVAARGNQLGARQRGALRNTAYPRSTSKLDAAGSANALDISVFFARDIVAADVKLDQRPIVADGIS